MLRASQISVVRQELSKFCTKLPSEEVIKKACEEAGSVEDAVSSIAFSTHLMSKEASDAQRIGVLNSLGLDFESLKQARIAAANQTYFDSLGS